VLGLGNLILAVIILRSASSMCECECSVHCAYLTAFRSIMNLYIRYVMG